jgi:hypothetical protein
MNNIGGDKINFYLFQRVYSHAVNEGEPRTVDHKMSEANAPSKLSILL